MAMAAQVHLRIHVNPVSPSVFDYIHSTFAKQIGPGGPSFANLNRYLWSLSGLSQPHTFLLFPLKSLNVCPAFTSCHVMSCLYVFLSFCLSFFVSFFLSFVLSCFLSCFRAFVLSFLPSFLPSFGCTLVHVHMYSHSQAVNAQDFLTLLRSN